MKRFDIYNAVVEWSGSHDLRPWLIVEVRSGDMLACFPISGQCYDANCFFIESNQADFPFTGLTKSCFIHDSHIIEIPASKFKLKRGQLQGQLLIDFLDYSGLSC